MRSRLDAVMDDPVARGKDGARLAARQTSTRRPRPERAVRETVRPAQSSCSYSEHENPGLKVPSGRVRTVG